MAEQSNRLNFVGALSLVAVLIGAIWVSANGDESVGVVILLWIGVFFGVIQVRPPSPLLSPASATPPPPPPL